MTNTRNIMTYSPECLQNTNTNSNSKLFSQVLVWHNLMIRKVMLTAFGAQLHKITAFGAQNALEVNPVPKHVNKDKEKT